MTRINPKNLRLTKSAFEYDADPSFDLMEGGRYKALRMLITKIIKERNYNLDDVKKLMEKLDSGEIYQHICSDCNKDIFSNKLYLDCKECDQRMTSFLMRKNNFTCSNCSKSWIGYVYDEKCPSCRK